MRLSLCRRANESGLIRSYSPPTSMFLVRSEIKPTSVTKRTSPVSHFLTFNRITLMPIFCNRWAVAAQVDAPGNKRILTG